MRVFASDDFVEKRSERIHVAHRGDRLPTDLLGRRVSRRQSLMLSQSHFERQLVSGDQFCDPEVEQLRFAIFGYKNIPGLQVAMHDEVLMRKLDGRADLQEQ